MRVLILGGSGFIGRNVVRACLGNQMQVTVSGRSIQTATRKLGSLANQCAITKVQFEKNLSASDWLPILENFDCVINCVGILRQRPNEAYEAVYITAPTALANACRQLSAQLNRMDNPIRFIHITALGLRADAKSGFNTCKFNSEISVAQVALQKETPGTLDYSIVRPSILDGEGGFGAVWLRRVANWPIHLIPSSAQGQLAPLQVSELGQAIAKLCQLRQREDLRIVECGGPQLMSMSDYLLRLRSNLKPPVLRIAVPQILARIASHFFDLIHFSPLSFGHLELMTQDNKPSVNRMTELLGHEPRRIGV